MATAPSLTSNDEISLAITANSAVGDKLVVSVCHGVGTFVDMKLPSVEHIL
jgi:putative intracellular protease/amidase